MSEHPLRGVVTLADGTQAFGRFVVDGRPPSPADKRRRINRMHIREMLANFGVSAVGTIPSDAADRAYAVYHAALPDDHVHLEPEARRVATRNAVFASGVAIGVFRTEVRS